MTAEHKTVSEGLRALGYGGEVEEFYSEESDDPDEVRKTLDLARLAAHFERRGRTERAVAIELLYDPPDEQSRGRIVATIVTPDGDRAREREVTEAAVVHAVKWLRRFDTIEPLLAALRAEVRRLESGETTEAEVLSLVRRIFAPTAPATEAP